MTARTILDLKAEVACLFSFRDDARPKTIQIIK